MPRPSQDPVQIAFGAAIPSTPPTAPQTILDPEANQWVITLAASGGQVVIVTTILEVPAAYLWWYLPSAAVWRRDVRPWNVPAPMTIDPGGQEDLVRARVGATGLYLQLPQVGGLGTLTATVTPVRGGA